MRADGRSSSTPPFDRAISFRQAEDWLKFGSGAALLLLGVSRRNALVGALLTAASMPILYRGVTGRWPMCTSDGLQRDDTKTALGGSRGIHVRESTRLEVPLADAYACWRRLENLPRFMTHLDSVTESAGGKSHWVVRGPAALAVEWDAEIINEIDNKLIAWRSLPGSDVVSAGSVSFDAARGGRSTQVSVDLQYAPPAGKPGALVASIFGRDFSRTLREDLRHFKQLLEAGEIPRTATTATA